MSRADSVTSSEIILKDDERLVHFVGMIYRKREDENVVDVNLERIATYAQQLDDLDHRRQIMFISPSEMYRLSDNERANICGELARRYRPRNLKLLLSIESPDQTHLFNQNYGDSQVLVYNSTSEPLLLDDMDVRNYFDYEFEGTVLFPVLSVMNLLRRCRGPVTFVHDGRTPTFDLPIATIVDPLKTLLSFLWQEASSSDRGRFDLTFTTSLNSQEKQQLHQHCIDISPGETQSENGLTYAKIPTPDGSSVVYIHMDTNPTGSFLHFADLRVYTRRFLSGEGVPTPLEPRWTPRLTSMARSEGARQQEAEW